DEFGQTYVGRAIQLSTHQIRARVAHQLTPRGRAARIARVRRGRGFTLPVKAPMQGRLEVNWFATRSRRAGAKRVLVATGHVRYVVADTQPVRLRLTRTGRRLLRHATSLRLIAQGRFAPTGYQPISAIKRIKLRG